MAEAGLHERSTSRGAIVKADGVLHSAIDLLQVAMMDLNTLQLDMLESAEDGGGANRFGKVLNAVQKLEKETELGGELLRMARRQLGVTDEERKAEAIFSYHEHASSALSTTTITTTSNNSQFHASSSSSGATEARDSIPPSRASLHST